MGAGQLVSPRLAERGRNRGRRAGTRGGRHGDIALVAGLAAGPGDPHRHRYGHGLRRVFRANAFIPDFLDQTARHNLISPSLALLNGAQLLTAPAVALWPRLLTGRAGFIGSAAIMAAAQLGLVLTPGVGAVVWAPVLGFSTALAFVVVLSLPPRVAPPGGVARMSAAIFTLQYATAFVIPLIAGALWDATGRALLAFLPGIAAAVAMAWGAMSLRIPDRMQNSP